MADAKWVEGDRARYEGIMERRRGQEVTIAITSAGGLVSCRFPDGAVIGCNPKGLRAGA